jgi:hypothetical protein
VAAYDEIYGGQEAVSACTKMIALFRTKARFNPHDKAISGRAEASLGFLERLKNNRNEADVPLQVRLHSTGRKEWISVRLPFVAGVICFVSALVFGNSSNLVVFDLMILGSIWVSLCLNIWLRKKLAREDKSLNERLTHFVK